MCTHKRRADDPGQPTGAVPSTRSPASATRKEAERALFRQAQAGCRVCLNELMEKHDGLVHAVVRKQILGNLPYDEALQAGRIGLWRAVLGYDPDRGAFSTYAWPSITRHIWRAVKEAERLVQPLAVMPAEPPLRTPAPELVWEAGAIHDALYDLVKRQPTRLRTIIIARYGLNGRPVAFYREIGIRLRLSGERVRQLHTEALVMLRHAAHSQHLRSLLGYHTVADYEWAETLAQRWLRKRGGRHG
ncbi:MAG: sigma-70 family RNA polymerase sigma factor [Anaerolineae bacterium]|jgi:RNA polymerase sigma factor (sigma-70 family)